MAWDAGPAFAGPDSDVSRCAGGHSCLLPARLRSSGSLLGADIHGALPTSLATLSTRKFPRPDIAIAGDLIRQTFATLSGEIELAADDVGEPGYSRTPEITRTAPAWCPLRT